MAWEEWEQLKAEGAAPSAPSGGMRLNQHAAGQGGSSGPDLKVQHQQLRALGTLAVSGDYQQWSGQRQLLHGELGRYGGPG
ncbi:hypothetical protein [Streptomyces abyssomicinicus]|uniref:hypothetical protein n=1 Tax=Streptomyces abyssomicinicus TaxID=574929 RepID=UPI00124FB92D|nr:hypothetical protein [Streptomyces abyssomicinicus]